MNTRKSIAVVVAMAITVAGLGSIANYSNAAADAARDTGNARVETIQTMPTLNVHPTREQLQQLRGEKVNEPTTTAAGMLYYSFAADAVGA